MRVRLPVLGERKKGVRGREGGGETERGRRKESDTSLKRERAKPVRQCLKVCKAQL